jgi:predicted HTH domain antitoxin
MHVSKKESGQIMVSYPLWLMKLAGTWGERFSEADFSKEMRILSLIKLYEEGKISSGHGAKALGISRIDFLDLLARHGVSYLDIPADELESDLTNGLKAAEKAGVNQVL